MAAVHPQDAEVKLGELRTLVKSVDDTCARMAATFCEDPAKFKLEDCLETFRLFCDQILKCQQV